MGGGGGLENRKREDKQENPKSRLVTYLSVRGPYSARLLTATAADVERKKKRTDILF